MKSENGMKNEIDLSHSFQVESNLVGVGSDAETWTSHPVTWMSLVLVLASVWQMSMSASWLLVKSFALGFLGLLFAFLCLRHFFYVRTRSISNYKVNQHDGSRHVHIQSAGITVRPRGSRAMKFVLLLEFAFAVFLCTHAVMQFVGRNKQPDWSWVPDGCLMPPHEEPAAGFNPIGPPCKKGFFEEACGISGQGGNCWRADVELSSTPEYVVRTIDYFMESDGMSKVIKRREDFTRDEDDTRFFFMHASFPESFWGWIDDIAIAVQWRNSTEARIVVQSQSRMGTDDDGVNRDRVERILDVLCAVPGTCDGANNRGWARATGAPLMPLTTAPTRYLNEPCEEAARICEEGGKGIVFPLFSAEHNWSKPLRASLYFIGLGWSFMGVAIIADIFMCAIETITSKESVKIINVNGKERRFHVMVWNPTVANLTLMALGSSAPEILLAVFEVTLMNNFYSGDLGPSTIVGSAAFNMFFIIAVCIVAIPAPEVRILKDLNVFAITAFFSLFAYFWLIVILQFNSPNVVTIMEGAITFGFFFLLVLLAYLADIGFFSRQDKTSSYLVSATADNHGHGHQVDLMRTLREKYGDLTEEQFQQVAHFELSEMQKGAHKSKAMYRVEATRHMTGAKVHLHEHDDDYRRPSQEAKFKVPQLQFSSSDFGDLECCVHCKVRVERLGPRDVRCSVDYHTKDGTAVAGEDYEAVSGTLQFESGDDHKLILIPFIDDNQWEPDETLTVHLTNPVDCQLGKLEMTTVTIINDDDPGYFAFSQEHYIVPPTQDKIVVVVQRNNGSSGVVSCKYKTKNGNAIGGADFKSREGVLEFVHGESTKTLEIEILSKSVDRLKDEHFQVILEDPEGGAQFTQETSGGLDREVCDVMIQGGGGGGGINMGHFMNKDQMRMASSNWIDQFKEALECEGDNDEPPTWLQRVAWAIALPWKLIFAFVPPSDFNGGWAQFFIALMFIGGVTIAIGDLAAIFGCIIDLEDAVTAITFVALGTSLPDTFASKAAAVGDPDADASVGNVTGSNSVNVFLGLGVPWLIASLYWKLMEGDAANYSDWQAYLDKLICTEKMTLKERAEIEASFPNGAFVVVAGDLAFSVTLFCLLAFSALMTLMLRRKYCGGELGGPRKLAWGSSFLFVFLWMIYVVVSSLKVYKHI